MIWNDDDIPPQPDVMWRFCARCSSPYRADLGGCSCCGFDEPTRHVTRTGGLRPTPVLRMRPAGQVRPGDAVQGKSGQVMRVKHVLEQGCEVYGLQVEFHGAVSGVHRIWVYRAKDMLRTLRGAIQWG